MTSRSPRLTHPIFPNLFWRSLEPSDLVALVALATASLNADGGLPLAATNDFIQKRYLDAQATLGAFDAERLVACAAVQTASSDHEHRATIVGQVHPVYCRRGLGTSLLDWSVAQSRAHLVDISADRRRVLVIATESLTDAAARLYAQHGFVQQFAEQVMQRELLGPLPDAPLAPDLTLATWTPALARAFFEVYQAAFKERPGFPGWSAEQWIDWIAGDDDFRPDLSLLAFHGGRAIGFIVCAEGWIVQVGIEPGWRERGIASALIVEVLRRVQAEGGTHVMLDVNVNNPGAARVYAQLGFRVVGCRARYTA